MNESYNLDNTTIESNCDDQNWYSYISYGLNVVLLITTIVSEWMANSKCKSNGIIDGIKKTVSRRIDDVNTYTEDKIKNTILNNTELIFQLVEKIQAMKEPPLDRPLNNVEVMI